MKELIGTTSIGENITAETVDLTEVYKDLTSNNLIRTPKINKEFTLFAKLLAQKQSFSSRVHTWFKELVK